MTAVDLDALDKLRGAATPGPWRPHGEHLIVDERGVSLIANEVDKDDAALIVAAVNALPDLIAEARKYRALREAVEGLAAKLDRDSERAYQRSCGHRDEGSDGQYRAYEDSADRLRAAVTTVDGEQ